MRAGRAIVIGSLMALLAGAGVTATLAQQEPQPAQAAPDPIGDLLKEAAPVAPPTTPAPTAPPPPVVLPPTPTGQPSQLQQDLAEAAADEPEEEEAEEEAEEETETVAAAPEEPPVPAGRRTRRPVAIVQAIDKITAETMRFEVRVGGPPVRFGSSLIVVARACEVTASDEPLRDAAAYLEIRSQPRGVQQAASARQIFRGWMFASAPGVTRLEHPIYDAWVVGCRA